MEEAAAQEIGTIWSALPRETEFWSAVVGAIVGAVVGGLIAYFVQVKALREGRQQRAEEHVRLQQALGTALLFKMVTIHSNLFHIHRHIEDCFEESARKGLGPEPWQFVLPIVNLPDPVRFSSEEMGMLLALKEDDVFNSVVSMDHIHNGLIAAVSALNTERAALAERLQASPAEQAGGAVFTHVLNQDQVKVLRPRMIQVNTLAENIRGRAKKDLDDSGVSLDGLHQVLRDKLGLSYKLESKVGPTVPSVPETPVT